jgi:hypothetical protein
LSQRGGQDRSTLTPRLAQLGIFPKDAPVFA